jgi:hypothetical protein
MPINPRRTKRSEVFVKLGTVSAALTGSPPIRVAERIGKWTE